LLDTFINGRLRNKITKKKTCTNYCIKLGLVFSPVFISVLRGFFFTQNIDKCYLLIDYKKYISFLGFSSSNALAV
jgi:hypothetical protein